LTRNTARHELTSVVKPPSNGPEIPARPITGPIVPRAFGSSGPSKLDLINPIVCGMINAAATPCTTRAPISTPDCVARAHAVDAVTKPVTPIRNIRRRPNTSPSRPPVISRAANGRV